MEGNQVVLILLKLLSLLLSKISNAIEKLAIMYLKNRQRKRELGLKKKKVIKADRIELMIAKQLEKRLVAREKELQEKVLTSKYKLDCYKLEMQSELAELEKNIRKLQGSLEIAKEPVEKKMIQRELNKSIEAKKDFEKEVNKNLLDITHKNDVLENEYKKLLENIKICDRSIDGFASDREKDMPESVRNKYEALVKDESLAYSKNRDIDIDIQQPLENQDRDIDQDKRIEREDIYIEGHDTLQLDSPPDNKYIEGYDPLLLNPPPDMTYVGFNIPLQINPSPGSTININSENKKDYKYEKVEDMPEDKMLSYLRTIYSEEDISDPDNVRAINSNYGLKSDYGIKVEPDKSDKGKDEFMKTYYEKQRRKSLSKQKENEIDI